MQAQLGHEPSQAELLAWLFTDEMLVMSGRLTIEEVLDDPLYQQYFADSDPFFEQNQAPFDPGVPLLVVSNGSLVSIVPGLPTPAERYHCMTAPRVETLRAWGWEVDVFFEEGTETTSMSEGPGHAWAMSRLVDLIYPDGLPPELE